MKEKVLIGLILTLIIKMKKKSIYVTKNLYMTN